MRLAATASAVMLALSTAVLAQIGAAPQDRPGNNVISSANGPGNATMPAPAPTDDAMTGAANMMDNSAAPPPREPR